MTHKLKVTLNDAVESALDSSRSPQSGPMLAWDTLAVLLSGYESSDNGGGFVDVTPIVHSREFTPAELPDPHRFGAVFQRLEK